MAGRAREGMGVGERAREGTGGREREGTGGREREGVAGRARKGVGSRRGGRGEGLVRACERVPVTYLTSTRDVARALGVGVGVG